MTDMTDEQFSAETNRIINDPLPFGRVTFAKELATHLKFLLCVPEPILEQLLTKLEAEHNEVAGRPLSPAIEALTKFLNVDIGRSNRNAKQCLGLLKAFLAVRSELIYNLREQLPDDLIPKQIV